MHGIFACLSGEHNWQFVVLAGGVCLLAGLAALALLHHARAHGGNRWAWIGCAALVLASGVWATYFVSVLACEPVEIAGIVAAIVVATIVGAIAGDHLGRRSERADLGDQNRIEDSERQLRVRNAWLDAALNNMTQGLCMFDAQERVVVLNRHFLEMYKLSPQIVRPGCTLIDLLRHRKAVGLLETDPDQYYQALKADLAKAKGTNWTLRTTDGRSILAHNQPMPDGGWVTTHEDVTVARNAEDEMREQKRKLDAALNHMSQGLCMFDAEGRIVVYNERYLQMYGFSAEDIVPGQTLWGLLQIRNERGLFKEQPEYFTVPLRQALADRRPVHFTVEMTDGRVFAVSNNPMPDGRWVATHEDITEQKRAEAALHTQRLQLDTALNNMSQGLCMFDADARLILCNQRYLQMYGLTAEDVPQGLPLVELLEKRRATGTWMREPGEYIQELRTALAKGETVTFTVQGPGNRVISIYNRPMPDGQWVSCHEDITERRSAEHQAEEQRRLLDAALNNMSQGLCMFDPEGRIVLFNERYLEMMKVSRDFLEDCTLAKLMAYRSATGEFVGDPQVLADSVREQMRQGHGQTKTIERNNGRVHQLTLRPRRAGGWVTTLEDVTERRIAQERLREQKLQLDAALDNMSHGLCMFDSEGRIVLFNTRYAEIVGFPLETLRGLSFIELLRRRKAKGDFSGDPEEFTASVFAAISEGRTITKVAPVRSGSTHRIVVQPMENGGWVSTIEDITEQERAERLLSEQKFQLDTALNNMSQGLNMFDADGRLVVCNERYAEMYRLTPEQVRPGRTVRDLVQARVDSGTFFAADPEQYSADLLDHITMRRTPNRAEMDLPDGRVIATFSQPTPNGGWVVTHEDITERRRAERERDRSQAVATTVIENVPSTIVVKDAQTLRYVLVNRAGEAYFGQQRETMIGKTSAEVFDPETNKLIEGHDQQLLSTGQYQFYDEHPTTTPGGGPRIVTTTRVPIRDAGGDIAYLLTVIEDRTNRKRAEAQIAHMVHHDPLTGLPNRLAFTECLRSTIETAARDGTSFCLMSLDLDRFKEANDVFGHIVGDDLLCEISRRLQKTVGGAFIARLGGDEFTVISTDAVTPAAAQSMADQILNAVAADCTIDGHHLRITTTIGVAMFPTDGNDAATLVANADAALYRAKSEGRGSYRFFEAGMDKSLRDRRALQHDLQTAIERGELTLYYQPQATIAGEVNGFEALVRWNHPTRGIVSPGAFIPLAEESGLIVHMGEWILRTACREAASWKKPLRIGINLSPVQFRHGDLVGMVHQILLETGLNPSRLELEITEGVLIGDFSRAVSILRRLKALGVRIAMDDFGTGYSSLSYLQSFPFDKIKIDKTFISNMESSPQSATIVRTVIALARGLSLPVLAEGVETQSQLAFLANEACDEVQGYLIGRPLPIQEYAEAVGLPGARRARGAAAS